LKIWSFLEHGIVYHGKKIIKSVYKNKWRVQDYDDELKTAISNIQDMIRASCLIPATWYQVPATHSPTVHALPAQPFLIGSAQGMNQAVWSMLMSAVVQIALGSYTQVVAAIKGDNIIVSSRGFNKDDLGSFITGLQAFTLICKSIGVQLSAKETVTARQSHNNCQKLALYGNQLSGTIKSTISALIEPENGDLDLKDMLSSILDKVSSNCHSEPHVASTVLLMGSYLYFATYVSPSFSPKFSDRSLVPPRLLIEHHLGSSYINGFSSMLPEIFLYTSGKDRNSIDFTSLVTLLDPNSLAPAPLVLLACNELRKPRSFAELMKAWTDPPRPRFSVRRATGGDKITELDRALQEECVSNSVLKSDLTMAQLEFNKNIPQDMKDRGEEFTKSLDLGKSITKAATVDLIKSLYSGYNSDNVQDLPIFRGQSSVVQRLSKLLPAELLSKVIDAQDSKRDTNFLARAGHNQMSLEQFMRLQNVSTFLEDEYYDELLHEYGECYSDSDDYDFDYAADSRAGTRPKT